jgi:hypothetical protein
MILAMAATMAIICKIIHVRIVRVTVLVVQTTLLAITVYPTISIAWRIVFPQLVTIQSVNSVEVTIPSAVFVRMATYGQVVDVWYVQLIV